MASPNHNVLVSAFQVPVSAGGTWNADVQAHDPVRLPAGSHPCTAAIELAAAGTLSYVNAYGETVTVAFGTAGIKPIEAAQILAATNVNVVLYF